MKKHVTTILATVVLVSLLTANHASAQKRWMAGLKAGVNGADLRGSQAGLFLSLPPRLEIRAPLGDKAWGFAGGGFIRMYVNDLFSLQAEAMYTQKGGQGNITGTVLYTASNNVDYLGDITGVMTLSLDYVEIPILGIFSFPGDDNWTLTGFGGIATAFTVNADARLDGKITFPQGNLSSVIVDYNETLDLDSMISSMDVGGIIGVGLEVAAGNVQLLFDARLTFGFMSVLESGDKGIYNQAVSVFGGIGIPFGSEI